ncbi:MAG: phosphate ABC transporter substrate-binding protein, partial [Anaerolineae bacterium]|nr:phosphate ABC transporter substrate-binding protein [Anaerolineae bacterium]
MRRLWTIFTLVLIAMLVAGCGGQATEVPVDAPTEAATEASSGGDSASVSISVAGSTTVQPLAELFAEAYTAANPNVKIDIQGGGSSTGVKSAGEGTVDIGNASREVKESELQEYTDLKVYVIAYDGIAMAAHPDIPVEDLTIDQVRGIFAGDITNWSEVGGPSESIIVVSREEGSGTRAAFEEMVMGEDGPVIVDTAILQPSNGSVRTTVSTTPNSIGYLSFGYLDDTVKALQVEGVAPTPANASNGSYPIVRPLNMMTKGEPTGETKKWLDFILSPEGQVLVTEEGFISVLGAEEEEEETAPSDGLSGNISIAGSTTVQPLAELFAEAFTAMNPAVKIDVQGGGSSTGVKSAGEGTVDIGNASREVKTSEFDEYPDIKVYAIAYDGIAIATQPGFAVTELTLEQVRDIFAGEITNWSEVGGPSENIIVVSREEGSGTRAAFEEMVLGEGPVIVDTAILQPSNGSVRTTVATTPNSIGYLSFGYLDNT